MGHRYACLAITAFFTLLLSMPAKAQVNEGDSLALVAFYQALDGDNWVDNAGWLEAPVAEWAGITVEGDRVTHIYIRDNNMTGSLPVELGQLTELRQLYLYQNGISGALPESLVMLEKLEELMLQSNAIEGTIPAFIVQLDSLRILDLFSNQFTGAIPDLSSLGNLEELLLGRNELTGVFPSWVLDLEKLHYIHFASMGLTGEVPADIFERLPNLRQFVVSDNELEGDVGLWFRDSTILTRFEISNNDFYGKLSDGVVSPEIGRWSINGNALTGIPDFSSAAQVKGWFRIQDNKLGFHELEKALAVETADNASRKSLGPQKPLLEAMEIIAHPADTMTFTAGSWGSKDTYQWLKDGEAIPGATDYAYHIAAYDSEDAGVYHCVISHPDFEFDLERSAIAVETEGVSSTTWFAMPEVSLYPNPARQRVTITGATVLSVDIFDTTGKQRTSSKTSGADVSVLKPGMYLARITTDAGQTMRWFVKI